MHNNTLLDMTAKSAGGLTSREHQLTQFMVAGCCRQHHKARQPMDAMQRSQAHGSLLWPMQERHSTQADDTVESDKGPRTAHCHLSKGSGAAAAAACGLPPVQPSSSVCHGPHLQQQLDGLVHTLAVLMTLTATPVQDRDQHGRTTTQTHVHSRASSCHGHC